MDFAFAVRLDGTFVTIGMSPIISFLFGIPETGRRHVDELNFRDSS